MRKMHMPTRGGPSRSPDAAPRRLAWSSPGRRGLPSCGTARTVRRTETAGPVIIGRRCNQTALRHLLRDSELQPGPDMKSSGVRESRIAHSRPTTTQTAHTHEWPH